MSPKWLSGIFSSPAPPKVKIDLTAQKTQYVLGEKIAGDFKIVSDEEFDVTQAIVWLTCKEDIKKSRTIGNQYGIQQSEYWDSGVTYSTSCVLFGAVHIPMGFRAAYPYSLAIASAAKETIYSVDHYVKWFLCGALELRSRPKIQTTVYEVQVGRPQINQGSNIVMKEVEREIVLIPCSYCNSLMPQTVLFCPNCGARRKT